MKKITLICCAIILCVISISAQKFEEHFTNNALRIDYIFSGDNESKEVALSGLTQLPQWSGRKHNLSELYLSGNGQISVYDLASNKCIYRDAFSTLFQEWQTTDEAKKLKRSFENTYLVPFPKQKVRVEISFRDRKGNYNKAFSHEVDPTDILIKKQGLRNTVPYRYIHKADSSLYSPINVAIVAEGYTKKDMQLFYKHARTAVSEIIAHTPFNRFADRFNFIAVETASAQSGVSVPRENKWQQTAFSSHFDTFYSDRYLTTSHVFDLHDAIAGIPYAHIIILAKTDVYGGGGIFNAYTLTTTGHRGFKPVVVHEFGHSFAGLGDEYFYESDVLDATYTTNIEPWEKNITSLVNFKDKWENLLMKGTPIPTHTDENSVKKYPIGVFEGAGYLSKGMYRSSTDCRMHTNTCDDFCPACQKVIEEIIKFYTEQK